MSQKISIILFIAAIVILGIIIYQYWGYEEKPEAPEGVGTEEGEIEEGETEEAAETEEGETEEGKEGAQTEEEILRIKNMALEMGDISICEEIKDETAKKECIDMLTVE